MRPDVNVLEPPTAQDMTCPTSVSRPRCRGPTCGQWCTASPAGTLVGVGSLRAGSGVRRLPQGRWLV